MRAGYGNLADEATVVCLDFITLGLGQQLVMSTHRGSFVMRGVVCCHPMAKQHRKQHVEDSMGCSLNLRQDFVIQ
jgi:hypothetical protein